MLREVTLNRASDYLKIVVLWIKVVKKYLQSKILYSVPLDVLRIKISRFSQN